MNDIAHKPLSVAEKQERTPPPKPNGAGLKPQRFVAEPFDEIRVGAEPEWLVKDIIPTSGIGMFIGEPSCGKSFLASDLALHIAMGKPWGGRVVAQGATVYVSGEGATGFRKRMMAARKHHRPKDGTPFYLIADAPDMGHRNGDAAALVARIREQVNEPIALIVFDTMARMMAGADENSTDDASVFVDQCTRVARVLECTVLIVHHVGKDATKGARGSSALRAAVDFEVTIQGQEGERSAMVSKSKDGEAGMVITFNLDPVDIERPDGSISTTCIVSIAKGWTHDNLVKAAAKITGPAKIALDALQLAIDEAGEIPPTTSRQNRTKRAVRTSLWRGYAEKLQISEADTPDSKRKAFKRAADKLQTTGKIGVWDEWVWIND